MLLFQDVQKKSGVELENIKQENVKLREKLEEVNCGLLCPGMYKIDF